MSFPPEFLDEVNATYTATNPALGGSRPDGDAVTDSVSTSKIPGGLAGGPSLREIHHLTIAWEPTWAAAGETSDGYWDELYERVVVPATNWDLDPKQITTADQIRSLLAPIRRALGAAGAGDSSVSAAALYVVPYAQGELPFVRLEWLASLTEPELAIVKRAANAWRLLQKPPAQTVNDVVAWLQAPFGPLGVELDELIRAIAAFVDLYNRAGQVGTYERLLAELDDLEAAVSAAYEFHAFRPATRVEPQYNFGVISTFRQAWLLLDYQAGELVGTIPLAPGEERTIKTTRSIKQRRGRKETERNLEITKDETARVSRAAEDVKARSEESTSVENKNDNLLGFLGGDNTLETAGSNVSAGVKQRVAELTERAARELRSERTVQVEAETQDDFSEESSQRISNPNTELTVTYLFYELEQRFLVTSYLHELTEVILIPFEVPAPAEVDESWLIRHAWVLRRVLPDDRLISTINYLTDDHAGLVAEVEILRAHVETQQMLVRANGVTLRDLRAKLDYTRSQVRQAIEAVPDDWGLLGGVIDFAVGLGADDEDVQAAKLEANRTALQWINDGLARAREDARRSADALEAAVAEYSDATRRLTKGLSEIQQLRVHVRDNILTYMQAIWAEENADQRYLRLYDMEVEHGTSWVREAPRTRIGPNGQPRETPVKRLVGPVSALHQIADLDRLLGFKGNYAIFPLTINTAVTQLMVDKVLESDQVEGEAGSSRPIHQAMREALLKWGFTDDRESLVDAITEAAAASPEDAQLIALPSTALMIEALPGENPLLEDFKLQHREVDLQLARTQQSNAHLENLRLAGRLLLDDPLVDDPETERIIYVPRDVDVVAPPNL